MKIRRNDPCGCGSGKKYKKCCMEKEQNLNTSKLGIEFKKPSNQFFKKFNSFDLLKSIAGLSAIPENHGKYVRMEELTLEIIQNYNTVDEIASQESLKSFLDKEYPSNPLEDPPVNQFVDLITFYGGDYLIFPGITESGSFILSNLLASVFHWPDSNIPEKLRGNCRQVAMLLLNLSNTIAQRLGYFRYQDGVANEPEIHVPTQSNFKDLKRAVLFTEDEMNSLLDKFSISKQALDEFLIDIDSPDFNNEHYEQTPLLSKLILFSKGEYLVVSPASISYALTHFIWTQAESMKCMPEVIAAYQNMLWNNTQVRLRQMGFVGISIEGVLRETTLPIKEGIFRFDDDKIAYVQLVYDDGKNFNKAERVNPKKSLLIKETIHQHKQETIARVRLSPKYGNFEILDLILISGIGRDFYYPIKNIKSTKTLPMLMFDFEVLCFLKTIDAIDLWKYSIAKEEQLPQASKLSFSFLDEYKLYKDSNESFYLTDKQKPDFIYVQPGSSYELIRKAKLIADEHSALRYNAERLGSVQVQLKEKYAPVYVELMGLTDSKLEFLLEGFFQPVWIKPKNETKGVTGSLKHIYWEINDAVAYWLWQVQEDIKMDLKPLGSMPITIFFDLVPKEKFESIEIDFKREENLFDKFQTSATKESLEVVIPSEIIPYLYGADNEGERVMVKSLLLGINKLLNVNKLPEISPERVEQIIQDRAPLGMKKKFFILYTNDNLLLDPSNLEEYRYVQEYDTSCVLSKIVPALGSNCPAVGDLTTQKEKDDLLHNIVQKALLPLLREKISQYSSTELLKKLISLNESLIRKREELRIFTPTRIACYVSVKEHQIDLHENLSNLNRSTLSIRCLIEHITAEPSAGIKPLSTTAVDELVAIMDQVISWGSLGDQIHFKLFDIEMGVLPSGRIGTDKTPSKEIYDPYYNSKTSENITDSISTFNQVFPQNEEIKGKEVPAKLDKAFVADFGISFTRLSQFMFLLTEIGIKQPSPFASMPLNDLKGAINKIARDKFDETEFQKAISFVGLQNRGKLETLPDGCEFIDIMPWRFNRILSLLRKPLIIVDGEKIKEDKIVYWGPRQMIVSRKYLESQCRSDRLRVSDDSEVAKALGQFAQERGDALVKKVIDSINQKDLIIDKDVYIGPKHSLKNEIDIGDIDVLLIDNKNKILFSLECKSISPSRNIKEMIEEVDKLFGSDSKMGWIGKHQRRHDWIEANRDQINSKYKVDIHDYRIKSLFITEEDMLTPHLKKQNLPIPFVTSYELEKEGYNILLK